MVFLTIPLAAIIGFFGNFYQEKLYTKNCMSNSSPRRPSLIRCGCSPYSRTRGETLRVVCGRTDLRRRTIHPRLHFVASSLALEWTRFGTSHYLHRDIQPLSRGVQLPRRLVRSLRFVSSRGTIALQECRRFRFPFVHYSALRRSNSTMGKSFVCLTATSTDSSSQASALAAFIALAMSAIPFILFKYGPRIRARVSPPTPLSSRRTRANHRVTVLDFSQNLRKQSRIYRIQIRNMFMLGILGC